MAEKRPAAGRPLWLVITLVSILMALAGIGAAYLTTTFLSDAWSRGQINLVDRFTRGTPNPDWPYLDAEDRTAQVCGAPVNCVQAVGNEPGVLPTHLIEHEIGVEVDGGHSDMTLGL